MLKTKTKTNKPAQAPATGARALFGDITKVKQGFKRVFAAPGRYRMEVTEIVTDVSKSPKTKGLTFFRAGLKILESEPFGEYTPTPVGETPTFVRFAQGSKADFDMREWRDLACALMDIHDEDVDWEGLDPADAEEFEIACADMIDGPSKYIGKEVIATVVAKPKTGDDGKTTVYTDWFFDPAG